MWIIIFFGIKFLLKVFILFNRVLILLEVEISILGRVLIRRLGVLVVVFIFICWGFG